MIGLGVSLFPLSLCTKMLPDIVTVCAQIAISISHVPELEHLRHTRWTNNCANPSVCSDTTGSFTCRCTAGYSGNGVNCSTCASGTFGTNGTSCSSCPANTTSGTGTFVCCHMYIGTGTLRLKHKTTLCSCYMCVQMSGCAYWPHQGHVLLPLQIEKHAIPVSYTFSHMRGTKYVHHIRTGSTAQSDCKCLASFFFNSTSQRCTRCPSSFFSPIGICMCVCNRYSYYVCNYVMIHVHTYICPIPTLCIHIRCPQLFLLANMCVYIVYTHGVCVYRVAKRCVI
jgi:hypothetical protein